MHHRPLQRGLTLLILLISGLSLAPAFAQSENVQTNRPVSIPLGEGEAPRQGEAPREDEAPAEPEPRRTDAPAEPRPHITIPEPLPAQERLPLGGSPPSQIDNAATSAQTGQVSASEGGSWILQTITALGIVLGLIFALRYLLQRITGMRSAPMTGRLVEVLARSPIAPRTHLLFLRIHQRIVVACQSPAGLQTLTELTDPNEIAAVLSQVEAGRANSITGSFRQILGRQDDPYEAVDSAESEAETSVDRTRNELSGLLARIRHLKRGGDE